LSSVFIALHSYQSGEKVLGWEQEVDNQRDSIDGHGWIPSADQTYIQLNRVYDYFATGEDE
jgi:hypothetical protein